MIPMIETRLISRQRRCYWHYVPDCLLAAICVLLNALPWPSSLLQRQDLLHGLHMYIVCIFSRKHIQC